MIVSKPVVDHRIYTIAPRGMAEFLKAFDQLAMPLLLKHLGAPLAFYTSSIGPLNDILQRVTGLWYSNPRTESHMTFRSGNGLCRKRAKKT